MEKRDRNTLSEQSNLCLAIICSTEREVYFSELADALACSEEEVKAYLYELSEFLKQTCFQLSITNTSVTILIKPEYIKKIPKKIIPVEQKLSNQAYEVLAIIAMKQPCTKQEIDKLRNVDNESVLQSLINAGLVKKLCNIQSQGTPALYCLTEKCIHAFGFTSYEEMVESIENLTQIKQ